METSPAPILSHKISLVCSLTKRNGNRALRKEPNPKIRVCSLTKRNGNVPRAAGYPDYSYRFAA